MKTKNLHSIAFTGEMVIEYAGELIRSTLTDKRERYYDGRGIGCYMFKIDDNLVVDATMRGNAARFINHSCEVSSLKSSFKANPHAPRTQSSTSDFSFFMIFSRTAIQRWLTFWGTSTSSFLPCVASFKAKSSPTTTNSHSKRPKYRAHADRENVASI